MSKEVEINKLINEALSRKGVSLLLFSAIGSGKSEFLTRLSNNYRTTFWFSPLTDDFENFAMLIAEKLFANNREKLRQINQVVYCRSAFNNEHVILNYLLNYIAGEKGEILFAFEQMGQVPKGFDWSCVERIIKHCPPNLKIAVASDRFINLNYHEFEKNWPMMVDEFSLPLNLRFEQFGIDAYFSQLTDENRQFLRDFLMIDYIQVEFAEKLYPESRALLERFSKHPSLLSERGGGMYKLSTEFRNYLEANLTIEPSMTSFALLNKQGDFYMETARYYKAFKCYARARNVGMVNKMIEFLVSDHAELLKVYRYIAQNAEFDVPVNYKDYPYYMLAVGLAKFVKGDYVATDRVVENIMTLKRLPQELLFLAASLRIRNLYTQGLYKEAYDYSVDNNFANIPHTDLFETEELFYLSLSSIIKGDLPLDLQKLVKYEKLYADNNHYREIWFVRVKEIIASAYYHIGNYRKGLEIQREIRSIVPFYTLPHDTVNYRFYAGDDMESIKSAVDTAIEKAESWDLSQDKSLLYAARGRICGFFGNTDDAIASYDKAVSLDVEDSRIKYANIAERVVAYARWRDVVYAKEVAHLYLKSTETYCPQFSNVMFYALSFCYYRQGEYDTAYRFAMECVKKSQTKSVYWLVSMAIAAGYLLKRNTIDNPLGLVANLLRTAENCGMDTMLVENVDIFTPIFEFAKANIVAVDYVELIEQRAAKKNAGIKNDVKLNVKLFGATGVSVDGQEVAWKTKKAKDLFLHYFIAGSEGIERSEIINILWNGYRYDSAINNLKTTNNIIRNTLNALGVRFKLEYFNSKYVLTIADAASDDAEFNRIMQDLDKEQNVNVQVRLIEDVSRRFNENYADDMKYSQFDKRRKVIAQQKVFWLLRSVKSFLRQGDNLEAKRFYEWLCAADPDTDYSALGRSINERIGVML